MALDGRCLGVLPLIRPCLDALAWLDRDGDLDGDGFYEYLTRSAQGNENQAWKDSDDGIVYENGRKVEAPIATCEEQGFVYAAKFMFAEVLWSLGERDEAARLFHEAAELKKRFNAAFWLDDLGFYAMGLDSRKRPIRSVGSNPGHCLATGIVDRERVLPTVGRLVANDLFTGWGIRTLSDRHPAYNPHSYHRGSVWPVENGTFALAFMRFGLHDHVDLLSRALFEAASLFDFNRLPEVFSGHRRDSGHPFPAVYPEANWPQAWSASAVFCLLQAMLGLYPYAPAGVLLADPHLPAWLPEITLRRLRVGGATATLRFLRKPDGSTSVTVEDLEGKLRVVRQPSPWSLTESGATTRLMDVLERFVSAVR